MAEQNITKRALEEQNEELRAENEALRATQESFEDRVARMEALVADQRSDPQHAGPEPVMYHDPFDTGVNPHHILKHPEGKVLSWKNPNIRNGSRGWRGWIPVTYDSEIGQKLLEYIPDPPAKMEGSANQDNYVRRGTDSILCALDEEMFLARQQKREMKALRKQQSANAHQNSVISPGVETFGDGVQRENSPPGGFKLAKPAPLMSEHPSHRTHMLDEE